MLTATPAKKKSVPGYSCTYCVAAAADVDIRVTYFTVVFNVFFLRDRIFSRIQNSNSSSHTYIYISPIEFIVFQSSIFIYHRADISPSTLTKPSEIQISRRGRFKMLIRPPPYSHNSAAVLQRIILLYNMRVRMCDAYIILYVL